MFILKYIFYSLKSIVIIVSIPFVLIQVLFTSKKKQEEKDKLKAKAFLDNAIECMDGNSQEAIVLFNKSALLGNSIAQYNLGVYYLAGKETPADYKQALRWFLLSADQDNIESTFKLGLMYIRGLGVEKSEQRALHFFKLAAAMDHPSAKEEIEKIEVKL